MSEARVHIDAQLQVRRDIESNWIAVDPVLRDGEIAYSKDVRRLKIGNGASRWSELSYLITDNLELDEKLEEALKVLDSLKKLSDLFYLTEDGKSIGTKYNLFSELEISANGLHVGSGSGGGTGGSSTLAGLMDVTLSSPDAGNILVYNGTHWVNKPQSELVPGIDLSDYYTRSEVDDKLGAYIKTTDADTKYAPLSGFNTLKSDFDALNAALNDDVSGKINTWNEIVDFVDEYSGSTDLATIISGLSTQVNGKVAISTYNDFLANEYNPLKTKVGAIEGNVTALQTLTGTHTDQISDLTSRMDAAETAISTNTNAIQAVDLKVTTLGNHMTEVDETIVAIQTQTDGINERLVDVETWKETTDTTVKNLSTQVSTNKTNIEKILGWFQLDSSGNLYTTYNFYSTKEISANGLGQGTGGSGGSGIIKSVLGVSALGTSLTEDNTAVFNAFATNKVYNDLVALASRVDNLATTTSAVGWKGEITSGKKIGTLTINGLENYLYAPATYAFSEITSKPTTLEGYGITDALFKAYGSTGAVDLNTIKTNGSYYVSSMATNKPNSYGQLICTRNLDTNAQIFISYVSEAMRFRGGNDANGYYAWRTVLDNANYSNYALPLTGGTIGGGLSNSFPLLISSTNAYTGLAFYTSGGTGYMRFQGGSTWGVTDADWNNTYTLLHTGNIGDYSIKRVYTSSLSDANDASYTDKCLRWFSEIPNGSANLPAFSGYQNGLLALPLHINGATAQLYFHRSDGLFYRGHVDRDWKTIAFTDSNVASATKLATARTIWGHSFDGTGDVTGNLFGKTKDFIIYGYDGANDYNVLDADSNNSHLHLGYGSAPKGYNTSVYGNNIYVCSGTSRATRMIVNSSGNVGIGTTTNISSRLTIAHSTTTEPTIAVDDHCNILGIAANKNNWLQRHILSSGWDSTRGDFLYLRTPSSQSTSPFIFMQREGLRVGINTENPEYTLDVKGNGHFSAALNVTEIYGQKPSGASYHRLRMISDSASQGFYIQAASYDGTSKAGKLYLTGYYADALAECHIWAASTEISNAVKIGTTLTAGATTLSSLTVNGGAVITSSAKINEVTYGYGTITFAGNIQINPTASGARVYLNTSTYGLTCTGGALSVGYIGEKSGYKFYVRSGNAYVEGNIVAEGEISGNVLNTGSDIRFKNRISDVVLDLDTMANAPMFRFTWKNRKDDRVYIGSSAQYWKGTNARELVSRGCDDFHRLDYSTLGVLMGVSIARKTKNHENRLENHEDRIKELEMKVESLEQENRRRRYGD